MNPCAFDSFRKTILTVVCVFYTFALMNQFSANEFEEDYNSSTSKEFYIDFDGDGEFDLDDDSDSEEGFSKKGKLSFDHIISQISIEISCTPQSLIQLKSPSFKLSGYIQEILRPPIFK